MNEAIFEADQLHGEPQPAKPMTGDRPGDHDCLGKSTCGGCDPNCPANTDKPQPVTPAAAVPEQGEFERVLEWQSWEENEGYPTHLKRTAELSAAHNRDMDASRKRIAELGTELKRSNTRAAKHYRAFCDEQERRSKDEAAFQEYRGRLETENAQLRADKAELQAQVPKTVKPITTMKATVNNVTRLGDDHFFAWYNCPLCNRSVCKEDIFCNCGVRIDWSREDA